MGQASVTIQDIRTHMRDVEQRNDLLERVEFTDKEIEKALQFAVDRFQMIPPFVQTSIPRALVILGTMAQLLTAEAIAQARNHLNYQDAGISVSTDDKWSAYLQLGEQLRAQFESAAEQVKVSQNAEEAFGGSHSPYWGLPIL